MLYDLSYRLADAYAERHEDPVSKSYRIEKFVRGILDAVHASNLSADDQWRYAAGLIGAPLGGPLFPRLNETADKGAGDIEIRHGENVMIGHEGDKLGPVQDILFDEGELVGIVVRPVGFFKRDVVVQVRFLDRSDDMALFLRMTRADVEQLATFEAPA